MKAKKYCQNNCLGFKKKFLISIQPVSKNSDKKQQSSESNSQHHIETPPFLRRKKYRNGDSRPKGIEKKKNRYLIPQTNPTSRATQARNKQTKKNQHENNHRYTTVSS